MRTRTVRTSSFVAALAAGALALSGQAFAQADNSNAVIDPAPSGGNAYSYGPNSTYDVYTHGRHDPRYADPMAPGRVYPSPYSYSEPMPPIVERADTAQPSANPSRVDPVTGAVTAPGYSGPKDVSK